MNLSPYCISQIEEENNLPSLLIFIASIKHKDSISTQVEYSFFNSVPDLCPLWSCVAINSLIPTAEVLCACPCRGLSVVLLVGVLVVPLHLS